MPDAYRYATIAHCEIQDSCTMVWRFIVDCRCRVRSPKTRFGISVTSSTVGHLGRTGAAETRSRQNVPKDAAGLLGISDNSHRKSSKQDRASPLRSQTRSQSYFTDTAPTCMERQMGEMENGTVAATINSATARLGAACNDIVHANWGSGNATNTNIAHRRNPTPRFTKDRC